MATDRPGEFSPEQVAKLEADLAYRVREVETLNADVAELTAALATRAREIEKLNADVAELTTALAARGAEVAELDASVAELKRALATRSHEVTDLARVVDARTRQAAELERAIFAASPAPESTVAPTGTPANAAAVRSAPTPLAAAPRLDYLGAAWTLVRTDFRIRYHGTLGGFLWALAKPVAMIGVLASVFSWLFAATPDYRLNLLVGIVLWDFFAEGSRTGMLSLLAKAHLIGKTAFPRWLLVVTSLATPLLTLAVFTGGLLAVLALAGRLPGPGPLAAFFGAQLALLSIVLGLAFATSVVVLRYRDLNQVWDVVLQAGFFLAPVVYPLSAVPESLRPWLMLWPPTAVLEYARAAAVGARVPEFATAGPLLAMVLLSLGAGIALYRRHAPAAAEYL
ncbi:MAG: ABC transporter permease [Vicinamibacteria bacterium]|nr:ABC transporter permease [Vicinamibacteria bacterium]